VRRCQSIDARFNAVLDLEGTLAICTSAQVQAHSTAVVFGTLFRQFEPASFGEAAAQRIIHSNGKELIDAYWGNYVAIWRDQRYQAFHILRGPASTLSCLHTRAENIDIFFSSMELCAQLGARSFSINWAHLARTLLGPAPGDQTDITEVAEILPGQVARVTAESLTRTEIWDPHRFSSTSELSDRTRAAQSLRTTARACVQAWASRHQRVIHALSGGLDSAVTLACLTSTANHPEIICLNQYASDLNSDERHYARLCAERAQCELVEH
jgi:asparagine synthase (glutamine-hydrolysing)